MSWIWSIEQAWDWISKLATQIAGKIGEFVLWLFAALREFGELAIGGVLNGLSSKFPTVPWDSVRGTLDGVNYFFPLTETISFATMLLTLWLLIFLYRLVKSWIPTVAS